MPLDGATARPILTVADIANAKEAETFGITEAILLAGALAPILGAIPAVFLSAPSNLGHLSSASSHTMD